MRFDERNGGISYRVVDFNVGGGVAEDSCLVLRGCLFLRGLLLSGGLLFLCWGGLGFLSHGGRCFSVEFQKV